MHNDIWGGSILLHHRIEFLTIVSFSLNVLTLQMYELSRLHPQFLKEEHYLEALQRHLLPSNFPLDQLPLSQFLSVNFPL